jgi:hypothetical protein
MSDRGPYDSEPDPTEVFPPLRDDPTRTPPAGLPPLGADRDPDPTRVMPPTQGDAPTTAVPSTGGPYRCTSRSPIPGTANRGRWPR